MSTIPTRLDAIQHQIEQMARQYDRSPDSVQLMAVSKTHAAAAIREAMATGQRRFGESYLQEAVGKIDQLADSSIEWHFIGRIQGNKTRLIAEHFDWVHSVANLKHAQRLNEQRPEGLPPLNICLQIKMGDEASKGGLTPDGAGAMIDQIRNLPRLKLEGLMTMPAPATRLEEQRHPFHLLRELRDRLATPELPLETLSMGMSDDLEAAIAEGATIVRIGTAIFGPRNYP